MKKSFKLVLSIITLVALLTAAYGIYEKYGSTALPKIQQADPDSRGGSKSGQSAGDTGLGDLSESADAEGESGAAASEESGRNASETNGANKSSGTPDSGMAEDSDAWGNGMQAGNGTSDGEQDDNKIMAPDFELEDIEGNKIKLSDYKGKYVILNFWTTWCTYCVHEMPDLDKLNDELEESENAVILAINVMEDSDTVRNCLEKKDINLKVLMDTDGTVAAAYGVYSYPTTFILNDDGSLYTYILGMTNFDTLKKVLDMARSGQKLR